MTDRPGEPPPLTARVAYFAIPGFMLLIPLIFDVRAADTFALPKTVALRAFGLALFGLAAVSTIWGRWPLSRQVKPDYLMPASILLWAAVATAASTSPLVSTYSFVTTVSAATLYVVTWQVAPSMKLGSVVVVMIAALGNVLVLALQKSGIWNPFLDGVDRTRVDRAVVIQLSESALFGNRDHVGTYLVLPAIVAFVLAIALRGRMRLLSSLAGILIVGGILLTKVTTAITALVITIVVVALCRSLRAVAVSVLAIAMIMAAGFAADSTLRHETVTKLHHVARGEFGSRFITSMAAMRMLGADPVTGVGPGRFGWAFYPEKLYIDREYKHYIAFLEVQNFGEAHNDHAQILAETGLPGYGLFLGVVVLLVKGGWKSWRAPEAMESIAARERFGLLIRIPLAVSLVVLMLAQFPLHIAPIVANYAYLAALARSWSTPV